MMESSETSQISRHESSCPKIVENSPNTVVTEADWSPRDEISPRTPSDDPFLQRDLKKNKSLASQEMTAVAVIEKLPAPLLMSASGKGTAGPTDDRHKRFGPAKRLPAPTFGQVQQPPRLEDGIKSRERRASIDAIKRRLDFLVDQRDPGLADDIAQAAEIHVCPPSVSPSVKPLDRRASIDAIKRRLDFLVDERDRREADAAAASAALEASVTHTTAVKPSLASLHARSADHGTPVASSMPASLRPSVPSTKRPDVLDEEERSTPAPPPSPHTHSTEWLLSLSSGGVMASAIEVDVSDARAPAASPPKTVRKARSRSWASMSKLLLLPGRRPAAAH